MNHLLRHRVVVGVILLLGLAASLGSADAQENCLEIERSSGFGSSTGFWVNQCSVGIHVRWRNYGGPCNDPTGCVGCQSNQFVKFPCSDFVAAYGRSTATLWGTTDWSECQSDDQYAIVITEPEYGVIRCASGDRPDGGSGSGGELELDCPCSYRVRGSSVYFDAEAVRNNQGGGTSGTLTLELWATNSPYTGGRLSGYVLGEGRLGELGAGRYYASPSFTRQLNLPPPGTYYVTMILTEYQGREVIVDYMAFDRTVTFEGDSGGGGSGGGGSGGGGSGGGGSGGGGSGDSDGSGGGCALLPPGSAFSGFDPVVPSLLVLIGVSLYCRHHRRVKTGSRPSTTPCEKPR